MLFKNPIFLAPSSHMSVGVQTMGINQALPWKYSRAMMEGDLLWYIFNLKLPSSHGKFHQSISHYT